MERISGMRKPTTPISEEQTVVQGNLAKLKMPEPKELHEDVLDDYYWKVNMGRRRKKLTISQLANEVGLSKEIVESIERGKIPKEHTEVFLKLENFLGTTLLKNRPQQISFRKTPEEEEDIIETVRRKMEGKGFSDTSKKEALEQVEKGEVDFSKRESLKDVTINDLVDMKKKKERAKEKKVEQNFMGDDIDLDIDL